jgi:hypothetical protein
LNSCRFRTQGCSLSTPCHNCRKTSSKLAHLHVRFESGADPDMYSKRTPTKYETARGGYWQRQAT